MGPKDDFQLRSPAHACPCFQKGQVVNPQFIRCIVRRAALGKVDQRMKVGGEFIGQGLG